MYNFKDNEKITFLKSVKDGKYKVCFLILFAILLFSNRNEIYKLYHPNIHRIVIDGEFQNQNIVKYYEEKINTNGDMLRVYIDKHGSFIAKIFTKDNKLLDKQIYNENGQLKILGTDIKLYIKNGELNLNGGF